MNAPCKNVFFVSPYCSIQSIFQRGFTFSLKIHSSFSIPKRQGQCPQNALWLSDGPLGQTLNPYPPFAARNNIYDACAETSPPQSEIPEMLLLL